MRCKYKSKIKKRKQRIFGEIEKTLDELKPAIIVSNKKMEKDAEEIIKTSPIFADLNRLCTKIIPKYEDFILDAINVDNNEGKLI